MAVLNWKQVYDLNSTTTFNANDVLYLARSPYGVGNDYGFLYSSLVPITTKGDLFTFSTANARLAVGANGTLLTPDSTAGTGLKWTTATFPATNVLGDVIYSSAANVYSNLAGNITAVKQYLSQTGTGAISAAPAWATIAGADITGDALTKSDDTNVTLTLGGTPATALLRATSITVGWTGTLAVTRGGTGTGTAFTAGSVVFAGASGVYSQDNAEFFWDNSTKRLGIGTVAPAHSVDTTGNVRAQGILISDQKLQVTGFVAPTSQGAHVAWNRVATGATAFMNQRGAGVGGWEWLNYDGTNVLTNTPMTLDSSGNLAILGNVTSGTWNATVIGPTYGGTNQTTYALGDTLYSSATNVLSKLAGNTTTTKQYLSQTGTGVISAAPTWATITGADITGDALTVGSDTNVTLTLGGTPTTALLRAASVTAGWTGQLSLSRGGTNANLTAADGAIPYSTATSFALLAHPGGLNHMFVSSATGAPHYTTTTMPDTVAANSLLWTNNATANILAVGTAGANQTLVSAGTGQLSFSSTLPTAVQGNITSLGTIASGTWNGTLVGVAYGGTGTSTVFTTGSVIFAGASGVYSQDNANIFYDDTANSLGLGTTSAVTRLNVNGVISLFDGGIKNYNGGIATEVNAGLIEIGINDSSTNRFGGSYTSADQGGFFRVDTRTGNNLFTFFTRPAGSTAGAGIVAYITSGGNIGLGANSVFTTATDGFPYIPSCAGIPTGVPTTLTGLTPTVYDSTNNELKIYNSGWKAPVGNYLQSYTPTIGDGTNNFTTVTAEGKYVVIGRTIHIWFFVSWTSKGTASGTIKISLPVTPTSIQRMPFNFGYFDGITCTTFLTAYAAASDANVYPLKFVSASASTNLTAADCNASGQLQCHGVIYL